MEEREVKLVENNEFKYKNEEKTEEKNISTNISTNKIISNLGSSGNTDSNIIIDEHKVPIESNIALEASEEALKNINLINNVENYNKIIDIGVSNNVSVNKGTTIENIKRDVDSCLKSFRLNNDTTKLLKYLQTVLSNKKFNIQNEMVTLTLIKNKLADSNQNSIVKSDLIDTIVKNLNGINAQANINENEIRDSEILKTFESFETELRGFENLLNENPIYSENDKLVRRLEFYKTYEAKIETACMKYKYANEGMKLLSFRQKIADLVAERDNQLSRSKLIQDKMQEGNVIVGMENNYRDKNMTVVKKNILALDDSEEKVNNWKADDTLTAEQIAAVRDIDAYMLSQATNEYKDKIFMQQVLGCTVRQRLAMYCCIERGLKNMDDHWLLFSQTEYLPKLNKVKGEMNGWSLFRKAGWKRGHWSKMRRAYEYVMGNRDFMDDMAEASLLQDENKLVQSNNLIKENDELNNAILDIDENEPVKISIEEQVDLHSQVVDLSKEILKEFKANGLKKVVNNPKWTQLSDLIAREIEVSGKNEKSKWKNYKKVLDYTGYYSQAKTISGVVETSLRMPGVLQGGVGSDIFDGIGTGDIYVAPILSFGNMVASIGDTVKNWSINSASANSKDVLKSLGSINSLLTSSASLYGMCTDFGYGLSSFTERRLKMAEAVTENIEKNGTNVTFGNDVLWTGTQVVGSIVTAGTALFDFKNIYDMTRSSKDIRALFAKKAHKNVGDAEFDEYKKNRHRRAIASLSDRIAARKITSTITNIACDGVGYLKYLVGFAPIGGIVAISTFAVKTIMTGVDKLLKRRSDYKTVDDFLDLDGQIREIKGNEKYDTEYKDRFRKRAMLQLGFANTKTFFAHVASRLGDIIHTTIKNKSEGKNQFITMLKAMGLHVDPANNIIPTAQQIAGKLAQ